MVTENIDQEEGVINGSLWIVKGISEDRTQLILEGFENKKRYDLLRSKSVVFTIRMRSFRRVNFAIDIAHACTIHKFQGLTAGELIVDLARLFASGQFYVALSRVRKLKNLYLFNTKEDIEYIDEEINILYKEKEKLYGKLLTDYSPLTKGLYKHMILTAITPYKSLIEKLGGLEEDKNQKEERTKEYNDLIKVFADHRNRKDKEMHISFGGLCGTDIHGPYIHRAPFTYFDKDDELNKRKTITSTPIQTIIPTPLPPKKIIPAIITKPKITKPKITKPEETKVSYIDYELSDSSSEDILPYYCAAGGLQNIGNTCFIASTLQCIRAVRELCHSTVDISESFDTSRLSAEDLEHYTNAKRIQIILNNIPSGVLYSEWQWLNIYIRTRWFPGDMGEQGDAEIVREELMEFMNNHSGTIVQYLMQVTERHTCTYCRGGERIVNQNPVQKLNIRINDDLPINIRSSALLKVNTLDINNFIISNVPCINGCPLNSNYLGNETLLEDPDILIITVGRFQFGRRASKRNNNVFISQVFEYDARILQFASDPIEYIKMYDLVAFVSHMGTLEGGHYISHCKLINESWIEYNDNTSRIIVDIRPFMENGRHGFTPYIYFYKRR